MHGLPADVYPSNRNPTACKWSGSEHAPYVQESQEGLRLELLPKVGIFKNLGNSGAHWGCELANGTRWHPCGWLDQGHCYLASRDRASDDDIEPMPLDLSLRQNLLDLLGHNVRWITGLAFADDQRDVWNYHPT